MKTLGILGGMGPEASVDLYGQIVERSYSNAGSDLKSYPHILINNVPIPNLFQQSGDEPGLYLGEQAKILENGGAKIMGIACNSAHSYLEFVRNALSDCKLLDMIEEVALRAKNEGYKKVGVLSSIMSRPLYAKHIEAQGLELVLPEKNEQDLVELIITAVLSGEKSPELTKRLGIHGQNLMDAGADCIVLGCTDLPLILTAEDVNYPIFSSTAILADAMIRESLA